MALWLPKWLRDEEGPPEIESRRTFIFMGAAAGILLVAEPVQLFTMADMPTGPVGFDFNLAEANRIIRELYSPVALGNLESRHHMPVDASCAYCGAGFCYKLLTCPKCGAKIRKIDVGIPQEMLDDIDLLQKLTRETT